MNASVEYLLAQRNAEGHWVGELSSSALSTATASFALWLALPQRPELQPLIESGIRWLVEKQNPDGGWGDTDRSPSNISTTTLCWAALQACAPEQTDAITQCSAWLTRATGTLTPETLAKTIADRYGKDRTFSVPILTMCALAGCLGPRETAWRLIPRLPFELATLPHRWFQWLQLPVVSYALPALIAIGQVGHHFNPALNPVTRLIRNGARSKTLALLRQIQPEGGGFLEAAPLTSFVTMSLLACGLHDSPVVREGLTFLVQSVRPDGSWPIDTNLATWVTTLAINALGSQLPQEDRTTLLEWLLNQQYKTEHPYTHAAPGGWAWTDLPGGVPDADDTPGALLAIANLTDGEPLTPKVRESVELGVTWLLDLQNRDGGMPTFCRGWGALPFDRSGADLTAHVLLAWHRWKPQLSSVLQKRIETATQRALAYLFAQQRPDGSWIPLWFGNDSAPDEANPTYGTARVLLALFALPSETHPELAQRRAQGLAWLLKAQHASGGWGGDIGCPPSIEETGLALAALRILPDTSAALTLGEHWLDEATQGGTHFPSAPIGFYFARLWYYEALYPVVFSVATKRL